MALLCNYSAILFSNLSFDIFKKVLNNKSLQHKPNVDLDFIDKERFLAYNKNAHILGICHFKKTFHSLIY